MKTSYKPVKNSLDLAFRPHPLIRNRHLQSIVSSLYKRKSPNLHRASQEMIVDAGDGVRLQGFYSPQSEGQPKGLGQSKGLVLLLHGWLGHAESNYVVAIGEYLYQRGYSIFRLNLRDHGDTFHLNPGVFRSDLLDEAVNATQRIAELEDDRPLHLIGASLGGNFALRLAWRHSQERRYNLGHTITICPVLDPYTSTAALDNHPIYLHYFRSKWRRALKKKQTLFPNLYNFSEELTHKTCMTLTDAFIKRYAPYPDATAYFKRYTITPEMMRNLRSPATIITAADDPVVPVADFYPFHNLSPRLQVYIQPYGGHVGFIDIFPYRRWISEAALTILENK